MLAVVGVLVRRSAPVQMPSEPAQCGGVAAGEVLSRCSTSAATRRRFGDVVPTYRSGNTDSPGMLTRMPTENQRSGFRGWGAVDGPSFAIDSSRTLRRGRRRCRTRRTCLRRIMHQASSMHLVPSDDARHPTVSTGRVPRGLRWRDEAVAGRLVSYHRLGRHAASCDERLERRCGTRCVANPRVAIGKLPSCTFRLHYYQHDRAAVGDRSIDAQAHATIDGSPAPKIALGSSRSARHRRQRSSTSPVLFIAGRSRLSNVVIDGSA